MNWIKFRRTMTKPITELKLRKQVVQNYHYRDIVEAVRKREELRLKLNEAIKKPNANGEVTKFKCYLELLDWVINYKEETV